MVSDKESTVSERGTVTNPFSDTFFRVLGFVSASILTGMIVTGLIFIISEDPGYEHTTSQSHTEYTHEDLNELINTMDDVIADNRSLLGRIKGDSRGSKD